MSCDESRERLPRDKRREHFLLAVEVVFDSLNVETLVGCDDILNPPRAVGRSSVDKLFEEVLVDGEGEGDRSCCYCTSWCRS